MKKISGISVLVSAIAWAGLCGCASNSSQSQTTAQPAQTAQAQPPPPKPKPKKDKRPIEERLAVGMTMDQVRDACGKPKNISVSSDGSAVWMYNNGQNAFIPYYSETGHKIHHVTIFFGTDGTVKSWNATDTGMY
jgi:hypothetical protein